MRRLKRLALVIAHSLLLGLASRGCFSPEVACAQQGMGIQGSTDYNKSFVKVGGDDGNSKMWVLQVDASGILKVVPQGIAGAWTVLAPNYFSTILCDCPGGITADSVMVSLASYPGWAHYGLVCRGRLWNGGAVGATKTTGDSTYAGLFGVQVWGSNTTALDTLSTFVATWLRNAATSDTIGSLGYPPNATNQATANSTANRVYERLFVIQNGTNGATSTDGAGYFNVPKIGAFVPLRWGSGDDQGYASNVGVRVNHRATYIDASAPAAMAANAGKPWLLVWDLVAWN